MTEYLITFNDEWVPAHTAAELRQKSKAARVVIDDMVAEGVLIFTNGGLDRSTAVFSVEAVDGEPVFTDGPYVETKEHLGGFAVVDVPDDAAARYWAGSQPCSTGRRRYTGSEAPGRPGVTAPARSERRAQVPIRAVPPSVAEAGRSSCAQP